MFKVGDKVKVIDYWQTYSSYDTFIKNNTPEYIKYFDNNAVPEKEMKEIYKIIFVLGETATIYKNQKVFVIHTKGLELVKEDDYIKQNNIKNIDKEIKELENAKEKHTNKIQRININITRLNNKKDELLKKEITIDELKEYYEKSEKVKIKIKE